MGMRHHSKRRSGVESRSAFAPFDGILGRITEPLARAASEIEIPAVNVWLNSPAEKLRAWWPISRPPEKWPLST